MKKVPKVLIVDDDKDLIEITTLKLKKYNFQVSSTQDPDAVLDILKKEDPDVILLDVKMPTTSGFDVAHQIEEHADKNHGKVIFFTSLGDENPDVMENNRRFSRECGAVDYLKKNIDLDKLANIIEEIAEKRDNA
ncbi:MAG: response regulator [Candidatus Paceibacterota bacterium]